MESSSLTQFLEAGTEKEFLGLRAIKDNEDKNQLDFSKLPNHVFGHLAIPSPLEGRGSIPAGKAIVGGLNNMRREGDDADKEAMANFIVRSHLTLAFLWIISRGPSQPIKLTDPPKSNRVEEACQNALRRLQRKGEEQPAKRSKGFTWGSRKGRNVNSQMNKLTGFVR
jgi:hypothetical protein